MNGFPIDTNVLSEYNRPGGPDAGVKSVISSQLSVISYQFTVHSYQLSVISYQSTVISLDPAATGIRGAPV